MASRAGEEQEEEQTPLLLPLPLPSQGGGDDGAFGLDNRNTSNEHDNDGDNDDDSDGDGKEYHRKSGLSRYVVVLTAFAALGGMLFGYDTGVVGGALPLLRNRFNLSSRLQEYVVSGAIAGAIPGAVFGGYLNDAFGRRPTMMLSSTVFLAGSITMGTAMDTWVLIVGRFIAGMGVGFASFSVPMYIAECSPADLRGVLVTTNTLFVTGGQVLSSLIDGLFAKTKFGWRYMLGLAGVPAFVQLIGLLLLLKESPRYLVQEGRLKEAESVFEKIYGCKSKQDTSTLNLAALSQVQKAMEDVKTEISTSMQGKTSLRNQIATIIESHTLRKALLLGCVLQALQQLTGINTIIYYSATILQQAGLVETTTAIWYSVLVTTANFLFTVIGLWAVDRFGRRRLTLISLSGVIIALFVLAGSFALKDTATRAVLVHGRDQCKYIDNCKACVEHSGCAFKPSTESKHYQGLCVEENSSEHGDHDHVSRFCPNKYWITSLTGLILYLAFFAPGMGPMPWTVTSELYPLRVRSLCTSITAGTNWISNFAVSVTFLTLCRAVTEKFAFIIYGSIGICGWLYLNRCMPETRGVKLEAAQSLFESSSSSNCDDDDASSSCGGRGKGRGMTTSSSASLNANLLHNRKPLSR